MDIPCKIPLFLVFNSKLIVYQKVNGQYPKKGLFFSVVESQA